MHQRRQSARDRSLLGGHWTYWCAHPNGHRPGANGGTRACLSAGHCAHHARSTCLHGSKRGMYEGLLQNSNEDLKLILLLYLHPAESISLRL